ncbi:MAG: DNA-binding protein [Bacilli bacterium]|jgi:predicted transcriptional regulator
MINNNTYTFLKADDVAEILKISKSFAYRVIKEMNEDLVKQGKIIIKGRVSERYFYERMGI